MSEGRKINHVEYSIKYLRSFCKLPSSIQDKAHIREQIFHADPYDVRLRTHKLHGQFQNYWAYSVDHKYRVIFRFLNGSDVLFFDIGLHPIYGKGE